MTGLSESIQRFDAVEANLAELDRLWSAIEELIPDTPEFDPPSEYLDLCERFREIQSKMPPIEGFLLEDVLLDYDEIGQLRLDALELSFEVESQFAIEKRIQAQGDALEEYKRCLWKERKKVIFPRVVDVAERTGRMLSDMTDLAAGLKASRRVPSEDAAALRGSLSEMEDLLGGLVKKSPEWAALRESVAAGTVSGLRRASAKIWPEVKTWMDRHGLVDRGLPIMDDRDLAHPGGSQGDEKANKSRLRGVSPSELPSTDPLGEFFVDWDEITAEEVSQFGVALSKAEDAESLRHFLRLNPILLVQHLGGGHGRWVLPMDQLAAEVAPDFVIGERSSIGTQWEAVVTASPLAERFDSEGNPTKALATAIRRIQEWRAWVTDNRELAVKERNEGGLGLLQISGRMRGLVLIGRRHPEDETRVRLRRQMGEDLNITIHSYDYLLSSAAGRIGATSTSPGLGKAEELGTQEGAGQVGGGLWAYRIRKTMRITGHSRRKGQNEVYVGDECALLGDRPLLLLLRLVRKLHSGKGGWIHFGDLAEENIVTEEGKYQAVKRLRDPFRLIRGLDPTALIESPHDGTIRLSVAPDLVWYDRKQLMDHKDKRIGQQAKKLPPVK